ncbi:hypothetical protein HIM_03035 [Hirsutella minnesotensis 3608]|nr:hypothetical protein HIM_03035 [Hirsutella minnesotensis 3608]
MASHPFANLPQGEIESLFSILAQYRNDPSPEKVNLMTGVYTTEHGQPFVLPAVKMARQKLFEDPAWNHEYPPSQLGRKEYRDLSSALFFGKDSLLLRDGLISSMQCLGATGACHMGAVFLKLHYEPFRDSPPGKVYIPSETWVNHRRVFHHVGLETGSLPWYNHATASLDIDALEAAIDLLPEKSVIVLQTAGNNPTGCDPSASQWRRLAAAFARHGHFAFLDASYPGFVTGDVEKDCEPIRLFAEANIPLLLAATYGKAFGLYGERVGILSITSSSRDLATRIERQMSLLARAETGSQPAFGAAIVTMILSDSELKRTWEGNLKEMVAQLVSRRDLLRKELAARSTLRNWDVVARQAGMFL